MTPPLEPEQLLRHKRWISRLAFELSGDRGQAEDLAQSAWVQALERPPETREDGSLRAWLAIVIRNLARGRTRTEIRQSRRERQIARPTTVPSAAESVQTFALQREVVEAVMELEPQSREIVVLRFFEDLSPREIAHRMGLSGSAVRSRLHRALAKLRDRLRESQDTDQRAWLSLISSIEGPVMGSPLIGAPLLGATAMKIKLTAGLVAVVLLVGALSVGINLMGKDNAEIDGESNHTVSAELANEALGAPQETEDVRTEIETAATTTRSREATRETLQIVGRCVNTLGIPIAGVSVTATRAPGVEPGRSDAAGQFELVLGWPVHPGQANWQGDLLFSGEGIANRPKRITAEGAGLHTVGDVELQPGGIVIGRVVDPQGQPIRNARALVWREALPADREQIEVWGTYAFGWSSSNTAADGTYRIEGVPATRLRVAVVQPRKLFGWTEAIVVATAEVTHAPDIVLHPASADRLVRGHVLAPDGSLLPGIKLSLGSGQKSSRTKSNAEGEFELIVARDSEYTITATDLENRWHSIRVVAVAAGTADLRIQFRSAHWIDVIVRDGRRRPVTKFHVSSSRHAAAAVRLRTEDVGPGHVRVLAPNDAFSIAISAPGFAHAAKGPYDAETRPDRLEFDLSSEGQIMGRVQVAGVPIAHARVHAHRALDEPARFSEGFVTHLDPATPSYVETTAEGLFELPFAKPGRYVVHVEAKGFARCDLGPYVITGGTQLNDVSIELSTGGTLEGQLLTADTVSPAGAVIALSRGDGHVEWQRVDGSGSFAFTNLTAGSWQVLRVDPDRVHFLGSKRTRGLNRDAETETVSADVIDGATTQVVLDSRTDVPCTLRGLILIGGKPPQNTGFWLANRVKRRFPALGADGRFEARMQVSGTHTFVMRDDRDRIQKMLYANLKLDPGDNSIVFEVETGTIELISPTKGCTVTWQRPPFTWQVVLAPGGQENVVLTDVPAGRVTIGKRVVELAAGATLRLD